MNIIEHVVEEKDVKEIFGEDIASLVQSVTNVSESESDSKAESKNKTIQKVFHSMSGDVRTIIIKLADSAGAIKESSSFFCSSKFLLHKEQL